MKLEKAIEILEKWYAGGYATRIDDMNPALQLGIEALKKLDDIRTCHPLFHNLLLPGEDSIIDNTRSLHTIRNILASSPGRECG